MRGVLLLGAGYHLLWGYFMVTAADSISIWLTQTESTNEPRVVFYLGIGALFTTLILFLGALYPRQLWLVLGLAPLIKILDGMAAYFMVANQAPTKKLYFYLLMNDGAWIIVLFLIIFKAFQARKASA